MIAEYELQSRQSTYRLEIHKSFLGWKKWFIFQDDKRFFVWGIRTVGRDMKFTHFKKIHDISQVLHNQVIFGKSPRVNHAIVLETRAFNTSSIREINRLG